MKSRICRAVKNKVLIAESVLKMRLQNAWEKPKFTGVLHVDAILKVIHVYGLFGSVVLRKDKFDL